MSKQINVTLIQSKTLQFSFPQELESQNLVLDFSQIYLISTKYITEFPNDNNFKIIINAQNDIKFVKIKNQDTNQDEYYYITDLKNQDILRSLIAVRHKVNDRNVKLKSPDSFQINISDSQNNSKKKEVFFLNNTKIRIPVFSNCSYEQKVIEAANNLHIPLNLIKYKKKSQSKDIRIDVPKFSVFLYQSNKQIFEYKCQTKINRILDIKKWCINKYKINQFKRKIRFYNKNHRIQQTETLFQFADDRIDVKTDIELTFWFNCRNFFRLKLFLPIDISCTDINDILHDEIIKINEDYLQNDEKLLLYYDKNNKRTLIKNKDTIKSIGLPHEFIVLREGDKKEYLQDSIMIKLWKLFYFLFVDLWISIFCNLLNKWDVEEEDDDQYDDNDQSSDEQLNLENLLISQDMESSERSAQIDQRVAESRKLKRQNTEERKQREKERKQAEERQRRNEILDQKRQQEDMKRRKEEDDKRKAEETQRRRAEEERKRIREEAERKRREEAERKRKEEAERKRQEEERKRREEEERKRKEEAERKRREEAERKRREEEERKRQEEEEERKRKEEEKNRKPPPKPRSYYTNILKKSTTEVPIEDEDDASRNIRASKRPNKENNRSTSTNQSQKQLPDKDNKSNKSDDKHTKQDEDKTFRQSQGQEIEIEEEVELNESKGQKIEIKEEEEVELNESKGNEEELKRQKEEEKRQKEKINIWPCKFKAIYNGVERPFMFFSNQKIRDIKKRIALSFDIKLHNINIILKNKKEKLNDTDEIGTHCNYDDRSLKLVLETYESDKKKKIYAKIQILGQNNLTEIEYKKGMTIGSLKDEIAENRKISIIYGGEIIPDNVLVESIIRSSDIIFQCDLNPDLDEEEEEEDY